MKNNEFAEALREWSKKVIEAQKAFDESDRYDPKVWYRTDLMAEAVQEILNKGFER